MAIPCRIPCLESTCRRADEPPSGLDICSFTLAMSFVWRMSNRDWPKRSDWEYNRTWNSCLFAIIVNKLNTRSSHRIEKKWNCNVKNLILCSCRHCNLWNYFGGVSLGNPRKLILVLLSYFLQQSSRLSFNNLQSTVYHSVYHVYGSHYCLFFRVFFFKLHDPLKFF